MGITRFSALAVGLSLAGSRIYLYTPSRIGVCGVYGRLFDLLGSLNRADGRHNDVCS